MCQRNTKQNKTEVAVSNPGRRGFGAKPVLSVYKRISSLRGVHSKQQLLHTASGQSQPTGETELTL